MLLSEHDEERQWTRCMRALETTDEKYVDGMLEFLLMLLEGNG